MIANVVVFVCVNVVGALMHSLMETAQRRAFLDTRNCIAARLDMEDENEKLVNISYSIYELPVTLIGLLRSSYNIYEVPVTLVGLQYSYIIISVRFLLPW